MGTWLSYGVSYLFIAIVWANHHHLLRHAKESTASLMWYNFAHLFSVSLLPLATAWMAVSELAPQPVAFYATVFFLVNLTYLLLIRELIDPMPENEVSPEVRRIMRLRAVTTLCLFGLAAILALNYPIVGLGSVAVAWQSISSPRREADKGRPESDVVAWSQYRIYSDTKKAAGRSQVAGVGGRLPNNRFACCP